MGSRDTEPSLKNRLIIFCPVQSLAKALTYLDVHLKRFNDKSQRKNRSLDE